jgi:uroporphyrinogen-III synthase
MKPLIVLRPEPGASTTCDAARDLGLDAVSIPLFTIEPLTWEAPEPAGFVGLLLTSANAVRCAGEKLRSLRGLKAYAVGNATAEAARTAGLDIASTGDAGVERLLGSLEPELKLLHLCGEDRKQPLKARQRIRAIPVYRSAELPDVDRIERVEGGVVLVHSPRAGARLAQLVDQAGLDRSSVTIAAISLDAATVVGTGWQAIQAAETPQDSALLALASRLCNNPERWWREAEPA